MRPEIKGRGRIGKLVQRKNFLMGRRVCAIGLFVQTARNKLSIFKFIWQSALPTPFTKGEGGAWTNSCFKGTVETFDTGTELRSGRRWHEANGYSEVARSRTCSTARSVIPLRTRSADLYPSFTNSVSTGTMAGCDARDSTLIRASETNGIIDWMTDCLIGIWLFQSSSLTAIQYANKVAATY